MFQAAQVVCGGFSLLEPAFEADYDFGKCKDGIFCLIRLGQENEDKSASLVEQG
jgi:hypothetical protein